MKEEEQYCNPCEFQIHPNNFNIEINEIKPKYIYGCRPLILDIKVKNSCRAKSTIKIKLEPHNGNLYFIEPSTFIYKANRGFFGLDIFQLCFTDEFGGNSIESILISVKKCRLNYKKIK